MNIDNLKWLTGQWEGLQGKGVYHEEWELSENDELKGRAYMILKSEIVNVESLKIHVIDNSVYYTADVSHNPAPVSFRLTSHTDTLFVFENPEHDFPQKITYEKKDDNILIAVVEATRNGNTRRIEYTLKRI